MSTDEPDTETEDPYESLEPAEADPDVPDWENEYLDRVSDRLMFNYDLTKDDRVLGEPFTMSGEMQVHHEKHFLHPALSFAHHDTFEHLFVRELPRATVADLDSLVDVGHDVADEWIDADEEHYATEFTFVAVTDDIPSDVREFVSTFRDRTMLRKGFHGHYEIHLLAVDPEAEQLVASEQADLDEAFRLWERLEEPEVTWWDLFKRRLQL
jgi:hypothetical protein